MLFFNYIFSQEYLKTNQFAKVITPRISGDRQNVALLPMTQIRNGETHPANEQLQNDKCYEIEKINRAISAL